jgi:hypothetical protein
MPGVDGCARRDMSVVGIEQMADRLKRRLNVSYDQELSSDIGRGGIYYLD